MLGKASDSVNISAEESVGYHKTLWNKHSLMIVILISRMKKGQNAMLASSYPTKWVQICQSKSKLWRKKTESVR